MRISLYDFGKITVDGAAFTRDVIIGPGGVDSPWWRQEGHNLVPQDLDAVWRQSPDVLHRRHRLSRPHAGAGRNGPMG